MKKVVLLLVFSLVLFGTFAYADDSMSPMASNIIKSTTAAVGSSGGSVSATCKITALSIVDEIGITDMYLYEEQGSTWVKVKSLKSSSKNDAITHSATLTYTGTPGRRYKCEGTAYAVKDGVKETRSCTSSIFTY